MKTLETINFIQNNKDWREALSQPPYCITIKDDGVYSILSYNQTPKGSNPASDMSLKIVQECRGLILDNEYLVPVCVPFFKFFNIQEPLASEIDWATARFEEKLDGSIIKLWYHDYAWHISTNGTIDACDAELSGLSEFKNYGELWEEAERNSFPVDFYKTLDKDYCHMFELVSPHNRVVLDYPRTEAIYLGSRNMLTLDEAVLPLNVKGKMSYSFSSLDECMDAINEMAGLEDISEEGFVIVDGSWNRVKVKNPKYVLWHKVRGNGVLTYKKIWEIILSGTQDDFVSIFPDTSIWFENVYDAIDAFTGTLFLEKDSMPKWNTRKEFAMWATKTSFSHFWFKWLDSGQILEPVEWLYSLNADKALEWLGLE